MELFDFSWLIRRPAWFVAVFFLLVDFGVLTVFNVWDLDHRGFDRPNAHLGFWMVVIFDLMLLPLLGYASARCYHALQLTPITGAQVWIAIGLASLVVGGYLAQTPKDYADWSTGWFAGNYHTGIVWLFAYYLALLLIRGGGRALLGQGEAQKWAWVSLGLVIVALGMFFILDVDVFRLGVKKPSKLLTPLLNRLFHRDFDWWNI